MRHFFLFTSLFVFLATASKAQEKESRHTIRGQIIDATTGEPLPYATISGLGRIRFTLQSNVDGYFSLMQVRSTDTLELNVSYLGYKTLRIKTIAPVGETTKDLILSLEPRTKELDEVEVKGVTTGISSLGSAGYIRLNTALLAKLPSFGERDILRALQLLPGVSAAQESSAGLYVRGGTPDQTLILYDGFTVYHVDHLNGFFSAFNPHALKDVQLYRGGFPAKFGGRASAIADLTSKNGNQKQFNVGGEMGLISGSAFLEGPIGKKITFLVTGRRSWQSPIYSSILQKFFSNSENQPSGSSSGTIEVTPDGSSSGSMDQTINFANSYFYDVNAKMVYRPTSKDILALSIFQGYDLMDNSFQDDASNYLPLPGETAIDPNLLSSTTDISRWGNTGASLKWSRQFSKSLYSNALVSYSSYFNNRDFYTKIALDSTQQQKEGSIEKNTIEDISIKWDMTWNPTLRHQIEWGTLLTKQAVSYLFTQNETTELTNKQQTATMWVGYLQDTWQVGKWEIQPGIRINYYSPTQKIYVEPRIAVQAKLTSYLQLKAAGGVYHQFIKPIIREDIFAGNRPFWLLAEDAELPVIRSIHQIVGLHYSKNAFQASVELYSKQNTGITEYSLRFTPSSSENLALQETFFNGNERSQGVDVLVQQKISKWSGWIGYSLADVQREISAFSANPYPADHDVRNQWKVIQLVELKKFDFSASWFYSSGRPFTSIDGNYRLTLLDGTQKTFLLPSAKNGNRFPDYHRLDVSTSYHISPRWTVNLTVFNAYNRRNTWYKRYAIDPLNQKNIQTTTVHFLPFTPTLRVNWKLHP